MVLPTMGGTTTWTELNVRWAHSKDMLTVTISQKPNPEEPVYTFPIEIEVGTKEGVQTHKWMDQKLQISIPWNGTNIRCLIPTRPYFPRSL